MKPTLKEENEKKTEMYQFLKEKEGMKRPNQQIICCWTKNTLEKAATDAKMNPNYCPLKRSKRLGPEILYEQSL